MTSTMSAPSLTECDHCGKRRHTVIIGVSIPNGPRGIEPHLCGQCLAEAMKELDRGMVELLAFYDDEQPVDVSGSPSDTLSAPESGSHP